MMNNKFQSKFDIGKLTTVCQQDKLDFADIQSVMQNRNQTTYRVIISKV